MEPIPGIKTSPQIDKLAEALAQAQALFTQVTKSKVVATGSYKYHYADLSDIKAAIAPGLQKSGLSIVQGVESDQLITVLVHSSGQWLSNAVPLISARGQGPQALGSALTYARRYGISSILGIVAEDDDDARGAQDAHEKGHRKLQVQTKTPNPPPTIPPGGRTPPGDVGKDTRGVTEKQITRLYAIAGSRKWSHDDVHKLLFEWYGMTSAKTLLRDQYERVCQYLETAQVKVRVGVVKAVPQFEGADDFLPDAG